MASLELKKNIEFVLLESYKRSRDKKFSDLNFLIPSEKSVLTFLKSKIKIFNQLDIYSLTFVTIHSHAKVALREFKSQCFEGGYIELLRQVLTLPEELNSDRLKSLKVTIKEAAALKAIRVEDSKKEISNIELRKNTKLVKPGLTGSKINKQKQKEKVEFETLTSIEFDENELEEDFQDLEI